MTPDFAAVDWGTSGFRLWLMGFDGQVHGESRGPEGMAHCITAGFAPVLDAHLKRAGAGPGLRVLICGMAGARQGWVEAPYATLPAEVGLLAARAVRLDVSMAGDRDIRILPGLAQRDPDAPDVMRGEETQLLGIASDGIEGLVCMPGTHCKWAWLRRGAVTGFKSYMTGELFDLLRQHSILRHAMPEQGHVSPDSPAFVAALDQAIADPAILPGALFGLRAGGLLEFARPDEALARLSGLLIGAEVGAEAARHAAGDITLVGQDGLGALYAAALARAGYRPNITDADAASRRGLLAAATEIWGER
ncbi:MAG: 2-dehydro-3-deoxygalactonokinase [Paracoccus sp. (in: a-proteobacteria)]|nr:2-dehydro-3-deoxygalactonokinase [Paracoccus sp. (in: a-proteobacteria)]